ncbi:V-set and immunoglobulin domain-containing protein 2 [Latimeria chalumnae]|uniref:V-set and immunoglobulin domain containing 2 n=1 Tax=Latimeria chalumnae TaxID=7897 RepID=M3XKW6_LATCH|nr:PREDICTED: V-set and immunoglobulin domain-containing protein 2 [Latimeria chalumnae]|eukprot:XP_014341138.1 PREDICTED: V-set and immunoglobulin domain-containing protein 2 [Latimeria chalumnae]
MFQKYSFLFTIIFLLFWGTSLCIDITVPKSPVIVKHGTNAVLTCNYRSSIAIGDLFNIDWSFRSKGKGPAARIAYYAGGKIYKFGSQADKIKFLQDPPTSGVASIEIDSAQPSDTGIYLCEVTNTPDVSGGAPGYINLTVLVPPSVPQCKVNGYTYIGNDVQLTCSSSEGTPAPTYTWTWDLSGTNKLLPPGAVEQDKNSGSLLLKNLSQEFTGKYNCLAANDLGEAKCTVSITPTYYSMAGVVVGALIGCLLFLALVGGILFYIFYYRKKHPKAPNVGNEIRQDAAAPGISLHKNSSAEDQPLHTPVERQHSSSTVNSKFNILV